MKKNQKAEISNLHNVLPNAYRALVRPIDSDNWASQSASEKPKLMMFHRRTPVHEMKKIFEDESLQDMFEIGAVLKKRNYRLPNQSAMPSILKVHWESKDELNRSEKVVRELLREREYDVIGITENLADLMPDYDYENEVLSGDFGTKEDPVIVPSMFSYRIVGCVGGTGEDAHELLWHMVREGKPTVCLECGQYFQHKRLSYIKPYKQGDVIPYGNPGGETAYAQNYYMEREEERIRLENSEKLASLESGEQPEKLKNPEKLQSPPREKQEETGINSGSKN